MTAASGVRGPARGAASDALAVRNAATLRSQPGLRLTPISLRLRVKLERDFCSVVLAAERRQCEEGDGASKAAVGAVPSFQARCTRGGWSGHLR